MKREVWHFRPEDRLLTLVNSFQEEQNITTRTEALHSLVYKLQEENKQLRIDNRCLRDYQKSQAEASPSQPVQKFTQEGIYCGHVQEIITQAECFNCKRQRLVPECQKLR